MTVPDHVMIAGSAPSLLVGREHEQAILRERLDAALAGRGGLILIGGEAGIGKTSLAEALCHEATERSALVLVGRCYDRTETPPYGLWVELFGRYLRKKGLPALPPAFAQRGTFGEVTSQMALFQQVLNFVIAATVERSLVLLLEDIHCADLASLDLLRFLSHTLDDYPLLLLVTYRSDEITHDHVLSHLLPALVREARAGRLDLRRLDPDDVRSLLLVRYDLPDADVARLVAHLHTRAHGNPLFTGEILRTLEEERVLRVVAGHWQLGDFTQTHVPPLVRQVIEQRLERLRGDARRHLAIAAIIGQEISLTLWMQAAEIGDAALLPTIEQAVTAYLLEESPDGSGMRFVHALIRETLYADTPLPIRQKWHGHVAELLTTHARPDPDMIANHFHRSGDVRAMEWLVLAGDRARRVYAWHTAIERYQMACDLMESAEEDAERRCWLLCMIGMLYRYTDPERGITYLRDAARLAIDGADPMLAAAALVYRGQLRTYARDWGGGVEDMIAGLAALDALVPADQERFWFVVNSDRMGSEFNPWASATAAFAITGRYAEARQTAERLFADVPVGETMHPSPPAQFANAYMALGEVHSVMGRPDEARSMWASARDCYRALDHHVMLGRVAMFELSWTVLAYRADHLTERQRLAAEAEAAWGRAGALLWGADLSPRCGRLALLILEGEWEEARRLAPALLRMAFFADDFQHEVARLTYRQGDVATAWEIIHRAMPAGPDTAPGSLRFLCGLELQRIAALLALDAGDLRVVRQWLEAHDQWARWNGIVLGHAEGHALWAMYYGAMKDVKHAYHHATQALACATEPRQPLALLAAHRLLGELNTAMGRVAYATTHLDAALGLATACAVPYERALTLLALAELRAATGQHAEASALLHEIRTICTPLGAALALTKADALAARLAGAAVVSPASYPAGLSVREVEVLRMIAAGESNRDIADALFLSERTVQVHVRHILTKTGAANRAAATAFALRNNLA